MRAIIELGWLIAPLIGLYYSIEYVGAAKTFWWGFAASFLVCLSIIPAYILRVIDQHHVLLTLHSLLVPGVFSILATIYGVAWWTFWKRRPSATAWAIAANLTYILVPLFTIWSKVRSSRSIRACTLVMLATGATGLVTFFRRDQEYDSRKAQAQTDS